MNKDLAWQTLAENRRRNDIDARKAWLHPLSVVFAALITGYFGYAAYVHIEKAKIEKIEEVIFVSADMAARCMDMQGQLNRIEKRCIQAKDYTRRSWAECEIKKRITP